MQGCVRGVNKALRFVWEMENDYSIRRLNSVTKETAKAEKRRGLERLTYNPDLCKGCYLCVNICPRQVIVKSKERNRRDAYPIAFEEGLDRTCSGCGICSMICPDYAIRVIE